MGCCQERKIQEFFGRFVDNESTSSEIGESKILRAISLKESDELVERPSKHPQCRTILDIIEATKIKQPNKPFLGSRSKILGVLCEYKWRTYSEIFEEIISCAKSYKELNLFEDIECEGVRYKFLGIYSKNREEYVISNIAGHYLGITCVPLYDILGPEGLCHILEQTKLQTVFASEECVNNLCKMRTQGILGMIKNLIVFDSIGSGMREDLLSQNADMRIIEYEELIERGKLSEVELGEDERSNGETTALISYTSGTTGVPKGVKLSHRNLIAGASGFADLPCLRTANNNDRYLSYLPMAHVYERIVLLNCYIFGVRIGMFNGDITQLANDIINLKPTIFTSVPRLYYSFYARITTKMAELKGFKAKLLEKGIKTKLDKLRRTAICTHTFYDKFIFNKMKKLVGGQIKFMVCAGAPIDKTILEMLKVCFCCQIVEGYGQTESSGCGTLTSLDDPLVSHVGSPLVCTEIKLVDVPSLDFFVSNKEDYNGVSTYMPKGEILIKGPTVFQGYFMNKKKTDKVLIDGWLHTGDIGKFLPGGRLTIFDRISNIFKLSHGEFISAEKLENMYSLSPYVTQIYVYGDGLRDYLVAIIVVDQPQIEKLAKNMFIQGDIDKILGNRRIVKAIITDLDKIAQEKQIDEFELERVKNVKLLKEAFTVENILTPTLKIKRTEAKSYFEYVIETLYQETVDVPIIKISATQVVTKRRHSYGNFKPKSKQVYPTNYFFD